MRGRCPARLRRHPAIAALIDAKAAAASGESRDRQYRPAQAQIPGVGR
jgi:hypothetical protein